MTPYWHKCQARVISTVSRIHGLIMKQDVGGGQPSLSKARHIVKISSGK